MPDCRYCSVEIFNTTHELRLEHYYDFQDYLIDKCSVGAKRILSMRFVLFAIRQREQLVAGKNKLYPIQILMTGLQAIIEEISLIYK
jgi:hypothetical protein